jgi:hypothetical protein
MRKLISLFAAILLSGLLAQAQQYDVLDKVNADVRKAYGMEGPHRIDEFGTLSKAPKGYKPFYISHYGRHGSRYAWDDETYTYLHKVFETAREKAVLTPYGESFAQKYEDFYQIPLINTGDLVPLGYDQHLAIGTFVYNQFPQVFKGRKKVDALSSTGQRCIVSMGAFTVGLMSGNPKLQVRLQSDHVGMGIIAPPSAPRAVRHYFEGQLTKPAGESVEEFVLRTIDAQATLDKLFTDSSFLEGLVEGSSALDFINELWNLYCGYHNYEEKPLFDDLFTPEQRLKWWEASNYFSYYSDLTARYGMIPLLQDILDKADEAIADPNRAAHLRFGHDYILEGLATLLNVNNMGHIVDKAEDAKYWFRNYDIPMAGTLLFVLYRNKQNDILVKVVLNENDAVLADLQPVEGVYYKWADFKAYAQQIIKDHPEIIRK